MPNYYFVDIIGKLNEVIFCGYVVVNENNFITNFYDFSLPLNDDSTWTDVLLPRNSQKAYPAADNKFPFTACGVNFQSKLLMEFLDLDYDVFGLYNSTPGKMDYKLWSQDKSISKQNYEINVSSVITPNCFKKGTKILCLNQFHKEDYISVEQIKKGDLIKTYSHGFRSVEKVDKIHVINNPQDSKNSMYKISKRHDNLGYVFKNLTLVGNHSVLVESLNDEQATKETSYYGNVFEIDGKVCSHCFLNDKFQIINEKRIYECYIIILQNDYISTMETGVWANGLLVKLPNEKENDFLNQKNIKKIFNDHIDNTIFTLEGKLKKNKDTEKLINNENQEKEMVINTEQEAINKSQKTFNETLKNNEEKLSILTNEIESVEKIKKDNENQVKLLQEQINILSTAKNEIENNVLEVERESEISINKLFEEIEDKLLNKEKLTEEIMEFNQNKQKVSEELEKLKNEVNNITNSKKTEEDENKTQEESVIVKEQKENE